MRRTMASQSSLYNEERNLLRIREWERRNQESLQEKEFSQENVPLFGEPYKTNKGDELSSRIQRMLGSYEDVNNPHPCSDGFAKDPSSSSSSSSSSSHVTFGRSSHGRPAHTDKAKPPFQSQNPSQYGSGLSGSSSSSGGGGNPSSSHSPPSLKKLPVPEPYGPSPRYSQSSLGHGQGSPPNPHPRKGEAWVDLRECTSLPPMLSALSPPAEPLSPLHSSEPSDSEPQDTDDKDTPERHRGFPGHPESPGSATKVSPLDPERDAAPPPPPPQANEGTTVLPSQTFPPPLASKPPNLVMPQKPTAYVRPMDGQDQVTNESPDLKTSPEGFRGQPYEPLPELKTSKPSLSKLKIPSQSIETLSNEVHCVEDILKEMTHSWPPLLTAIHTPSTAEPSKFSFPAKEAQHVPPAYPGQKPYGSPPTASQQSSSCPGAAAHSSGVESASSSDSESSSGSESDSESSEGEEAPPPLGGGSPAVKAEGPTVTNWQLNNWIRVSQQNPSTESQGEAPLHSPAPKQPPGAHEVEEEGVAAANHSLEFSDNQAKPQREGTHNNQHGRHKPPAVAVASSSSSSSHNPGSQRNTVGNKHPSKPAKSSRPDDPRPQAGLRVESVEVAPRDKDPSFTDRPKVKTKMGHGKSGAGKTDAKKSAKRSSSYKRKAEAASQGPKVRLAPDCKREADRGPSPRPSPAPVEQPSPAPAPAPTSAPNLAQTAKTSSKVRTETVPQNGQKKPPGAPPPPSSPAPRPSSKRGSSAKASGPPPFPSKALLVKIELSLITRVPQTSKPPQEDQDKTRRKKPPPERRDGNNATPIATKVSRKRPAGSEIKTQPKKRPKLEKEVKIPPPSSSSAAAAAAGPTSVKSVAHGAPGAAREKKKAKKASPQQPPTPQDPGKAPGPKRPAEEGPSAAAPNTTNPPAKHKKSSGKRAEHSKTGKKAPKTSFVVPAATTALNGRPLLKFEERQYPIEHHMKEAKKLKHKADDTSDKVGKAFNYLDAAMSFVESGIAMETDPQTPKSAYTMFAETLDLIRFIMKLKNSMDPSTPSTERDFTVICLKGQSLLQMAMFRYKRELALKYSRTLTEHFKSSSKTAQAPSPCISKSTGAPSPMSPMPSPASASSSGPGSNHSGGAGGPASNTVAIPQVIQQVACSYVNITALFLNAHDAWEQAQELTPKGSGVLSDLDSALGPLSLTSSMVSLVRYTRQGLHWLRLDTRGTQ